MATISEPISKPSYSDRIRAFDTRRDMNPVADLIELCFADSLDQDGRRYLRQMRAMARSPSFINWTPLTAEWIGAPAIGYVWEQNGQILGNASLIPYRVRGTRRFLIANVAVHPEHRRLGIAQSLTEQSIEYASQRKVDEVWLHVREENQAAVNLYCSMGFEEHARRTTWYSSKEFARRDIPGDLTITARNNKNWDQQKAWLENNYPPELCWHSPLNFNTLRPGIRGSLSRLLKNLYIQQWTVERYGELLGVVTWQSTTNYANPVWLAIPEDYNERALSALLLHVRRKTPSRRTLMLDFPAHYASQVIEGAGFYEHQTLIWMAKGIG